MVTLNPTTAVNYTVAVLYMSAPILVTDFY